MELPFCFVFVLQFFTEECLECCRKTMDFPAPQLSVPRVSVQLVNNTQVSDDVRRMEFEMAGRRLGFELI